MISCLVEVATFNLHVSCMFLFSCITTSLIQTIQLVQNKYTYPPFVFAPNQTTSHRNHKFEL